MRLDRHLAQQLGLARKVAAAAVRAGRVTVNGFVATQPAHGLRVERDEVTLDGGPVTARAIAAVTLMMNKPAGVVSARLDAAEPTVMELLGDEWRALGLTTIGRLDKDTTGLLLLTNEAGRVRALIHPERAIPKVYRAVWSGALAADAAERFARGLALDGETGRAVVCRPAALEVLGEGVGRVAVCEGKRHQVKRMLRACGARGVGLHRERIGALWLDAGLAPGQARALTEDEWALATRSMGPAEALAP